MKHRLFTLVELLTVIAVIAILAGIAIPVVVGMQSKGKETSARADMNAIKIALTQFKADYSIFPVAPSTNDTLLKALFKSGDTNDDSTNDAMMEELTTILTTPSSGAPASKTTFTYNTKKKRYLDAPAKPVTSVTGSAVFAKLDPWGRRYNIALDTNYDRKLILKKAFLGTDSDETIVGDIAIFSYGTAEDSGDTDAFLYSWKTNEK
ncbi:MAG: prepilin-type N-terminal cleavage/methylation domain-containing protein [Lentisphaeria bacterium]|nr:prepilin-type N-terminal cleavage/methylation domain-containing protein [Lentisphaeria bacterium]